MLNERLLEAKRTALQPGKPPKLPNLPKRVSVDDLLQTRLVMTVKRAWRKLRRPAVA
jgi:hypothetical protein